MLMPASPHRRLSMHLQDKTNGYGLVSPTKSSDKGAHSNDAAPTSQELLITLDTSSQMQRGPGDLPNGTHDITSKDSSPAENDNNDLPNGIHNTASKNSSPVEDNDYDDYLLDRSDTEEVTIKPIVLSEEQKKRHANRAALQQHLTTHGDEEDENGEDGKIRPKKSAAAKKVADESARIIDKARSYQQELFERAKEENILAVLDTGSGKTLIACLLIKHVLSEELIDRKNGKPPRTVVFLVNSVHLVIQQGQVLTNNLSQPPAILHGGMKQENLWKKDVWSRILEANQAVVCTAEVLNQALFHNYMSINSISLLIFDECHHAKKGHPYAKIMLDYYMYSTTGQRRPKIFGMTASPVDTKGHKDIRTTFGDLETLLHSKIVTTSNMSLLEHAPRAKNEEWIYDRPRHAFDTMLTLQIKSSCNIEELRQPLQFSQTASSTLGRWAANQIWKYIFSDKEADLLVKRYEQSKAYQQIETSEERQKMITALQDMAAMVKKHEFVKELKLEVGDLSSKVVVLAKQLKQRYAEDPELRTIVFVEQRWTAESLADCFRTLKLPNLKLGILLGANKASRSYCRTGSLSNEQHTVMEHFREGWINCVFATNVAEEGIDIPQCSLVVRFDLFKTPIQYMQSRGRARMKDSVYAMMVEKDNEDQRNDIDYAVESEKYVKDFCSSLPGDRILEPSEARLRKMVETYAGTKIFITPSGTRFSLNESLVILARYASSLQYRGAITTDVHYELSCRDKEFRYAVRLPDGVESLAKEKIRGEWMPNKTLAKRSAAWWCCHRLRSRKLLDDNMDSIYVRTQHKNNNAKWAVDNKKEKYEMKIKPDFWRRGEAVMAELYASVIHLVPSREMKHTLKPFVLFSRDSLPVIPRFPIYLENNISVEVVFEPLAIEVPISAEQLNDLTAYTLRSVFDDVFGKKYEHDCAAMSYWLAPYHGSQDQVTVPPRFENLVNVEELQAAREDRKSWEAGMSPDSWCHKFLVDKWTGAFRYISHDVVPGATVESPVPESALGTGKKSKRNVAEFTSSLFKKSRARNAKDLDFNQPVLECELFLARRDFLDISNEKDIVNNAIKCQAVPQPLEVGRIPPAMAYSIMAWPAVLHRLESYLIVLEAFAKLDLHVPADLALEAFTATGDNDEDGDQTHSISLRGMGKNYERLEFIGDSLLKMTTTLTIFCIKHKAAESDMHCDRMQMLCNNNLFNVAKDESMKLYQYARTNGFNRTTWYPEGLILTQGRGVKANPLPVQHDKLYQDLGKKTIADISEAIIGASYVASRDLPDRFDAGLKAITQLVRDDFHPVNKWSEIAPLYKPQSWQTQTNDVLAVDMTSKVEQAVGIGYHFKHPRLVRSALTHASDINSPVPDYQRLEFLGDAVLDMVSISWMFNKYQDKNPQWLTEHKMAMVSNKFLAALAVTIGFDKLIVASNVTLSSHVSGYASRVRAVWEQGKDHIDRNFWTEIENEPKSLSDLVEAYVGALMVDSGFDYRLVEKFFKKHILWFFEDLDLYAGFANRHPTTYLYQKLTDEFKCSNYAIEWAEIPGRLNVKIKAVVLIHHSVIEESIGESSKYARVRVSKKALQRLDGLTLQQFREEFGCNCKRKAEPEADVDREKTIEAQEATKEK
jgi:endoribonuclease Dicer